jgi:hypothetical protein
LRRRSIHRAAWLEKPLMFQRTSILDGMDINVLKTRMAAMQLAYLDLTTGNKVQVASYTQGDGSKSVSYTMANIAALTQAIIAVQTQIDQLSGIQLNRRRPLAPRFR